MDATLEELSVQQETEDQNYDMYVGPGPPRVRPAGRLCGSTEGGLATLASERGRA